MAFKMDTGDCNDQLECDVDENLTKPIGMLKSFRKVMRKFDKILGNNVSTNVKDNQHYIPKGGKFHNYW